MCANLQRLNQQPQKPEDEGGAGEHSIPPVPWATSNGFPAPSGSNQSPFKQDPAGAPPFPGGSIFAIPTGPSPDEIPGFPAPPGATRSPSGGPQGQARSSGIQPLSGMSIPQGQQQAAPFPAQSQGSPAQGHPSNYALPSAPGHAAPTQKPTQAHTQVQQPSYAAPPQAGAQGMPAFPSGQQAHAPAYNQAHPQTQVQAQTPQQYPSQTNLAAMMNGLTNTGRLTSAQLNGLPTDQLVTGYLDPYDAWFPEPRTIAETGLNQGLISDLVIKTMYFTSYMSGQEISAALRLPFYGIIDQITNLMKKEQLCDVSGTSGLGEAGYQYVLTAKGMERAAQVLARSSYVGPAPVPLARYIEAIKLENTNKAAITRESVERALKGMILSEELINQVGAAVNAGKSLFLFGAPGNGKTLLAEKVATVLGGNIAIPYALEADGQVIQLFDLNSHRPVVPAGTSETDSIKAELHDRRWVRIHRPVVVVGGELTMSSLDLVYNENAGFYEAPFQLKANGGLFLIDDFGRQQVSPQALLNRWIVPLEKSIDYLTLKTGKKLQVPFELFLVLSTNLQPEDLVDDAFLRRIQNKLLVPDPTPQQFYEIFFAQCRSMSVPFDQNSFSYLVNKHYVEVGRPFRASHPRDLLRQLIGLARYLNVPPELTPRLLDAACATYFVNARKK